MEGNANMFQVRLRGFELLSRTGFNSLMGEVINKSFEIVC